jgi:hypothetical protein
MSAVSCFLEIAIAILYRRHGSPHFNFTIFSGYEIIVTIRSGVVCAAFQSSAGGLVLK